MAKANVFRKPKGWIELICGPMFAGKSEELWRKLNRLQYAEIKYILFKPVIDTRNNEGLASRDGHKIKAINIKHSSEIIQHIKKMKTKPSVVAIDEAQFFDEQFADVCQYLADNKFNVYVAGLDTDFKGEPFKSILKVMAYAEKIIKLNAICTVCGAPATRTQRLINDKPANYNDPIIKVGDRESYEARCRMHHIVLGKPKLVSSNAKK